MTDKKSPLDEMNVMALAVLEKMSLGMLLELRERMIYVDAKNEQAGISASPKNIEIWEKVESRIAKLQGNAMSNKAKIAPLWNDDRIFKCMKTHGLTHMPRSEFVNIEAMTGAGAASAMIEMRHAYEQDRQQTKADLAAANERVELLEKQLAEIRQRLSQEQAAWEPIFGLILGKDDDDE